jgi:phage shock protein PspC (stress-responsive transcriptional regulator)
LLFALTLLAGGIGFVIYVLLWILVPLDIDAHASPQSSGR